MPTKTTRPQRKKARNTSPKRTRKRPGPVAPAGERLAYRVREVAELLGRDVSTVYQIIRVGQLRYGRLPGGTMFVSRAALLEYLDGSGDAA